MPNLPRAATTAEIRAGIQRRQLQVGLVGGCVLFGAATLHLLVMVGILLFATGGGVFDRRVPDVILVLEAIAVLSWVAGWVLCIVGWFGLGRVDVRKRFMGWFMSATYVIGILGFIGTMEAKRSADVFGVVLFALALVFYTVHGVVWLGHRADRGLARTAAVASFVAVALLGLGVVVLPGHFGVESTVMGFTSLMGGPFVAGIAHLAGGLATSRARASVSALTSFD